MAEKGSVTGANLSYTKIQCQGVGKTVQIF